MITEIYIEGNRVDLHDDEVMEFNSSVANTDDISKINTDYTKSFTVPASDNNNFIFKHYYNADIENTFDARTKKTSEIKLRGLPFKRGFTSLSKVSIENGRASNYTINFVGNLIKLKDVIGDDLLTSLTFDGTNFDYTSNFVKTSLINNGSLIGVLISKTKQYFYNSLLSDNTNTDKLVNIHHNGSNRGVKWTEVQLALKLLAIITAIQQKYPEIVFSNDFFGTPDFDNLYILLSNEDTGVKMIKTLVDLQNSSGTVTNVSLNLTTNEIILAPQTIIYRISTNVYVYTTGDSYNFVAEDAGGEVYKTTVISNNGLINFEFSVKATSERRIKIYIESNTISSVKVEFRVFNFVASLTINNTPQFTQAITNTFSASVNMPKLKVMDFLTGIFKAFKLVAIPNDDGSIYVNSLKAYYYNGGIIDITKYTDTNNYEVERGTLLNQLKFGFEEPTTILNKQFKLNTGLGYGDIDTKLKDAEGKLLEGGSLEIILPFENINFERLTDLNTSLLTNIQYGLSLDEKLEPANPKAVIFYNNNVQLGATKISFVNSNGISEIINTTINTPSHSLGLELPTQSFLFEGNLSTWNNTKIEETLYTNYWQDYILNIFDIKKREFTFKSILPAYLLTKIKLNDLLKIKSNYYRINDFTVNLLDGSAKFKLINNFDLIAGLFRPSSDSAFKNYVAQSFSIYVSNSDVMNLSFTDLGFGSGWITAIKNGTFIDFTLTENTEIQNRDVFLNVDNGSGKSFQIYVNQDNKIVSFDATIQKFDSDLLTFDAE